jgi:hypothetical protein
MSPRQLHLGVIWARHQDGHGIPDDHPQFVAAFPTSLSEFMPELWAEWVKAACDQYRDQCEAPVVAFYEGPVSIEAPEGFEGFHPDLIEDDAINPGWESALARLHPDPGAPPLPPPGPPDPPVAPMHRPVA